MRSSEIEGLGNVDRVNYPTFYTNGYTFDDNPETGFIPTLKSFSEEQNRNGKIDEPVYIVLSQDFFDLYYGKFDTPLKTLVFSRVPFKHLILKLDEDISPDVYKIEVEKFISFNFYVQSIQYIGFEHIVETSAFFATSNPDLKVIDMSSFITLEKPNGLFYFQTPVRTIYVAGETQKKLVEDYFQNIQNPPQVIIKTPNGHYLEKQTSKSIEEDVN